MVLVTQWLWYVLLLLFLFFWSFFWTTINIGSGGSIDPMVHTRNVDVAAVDKNFILA
jgi:hypothetical protein